MLDLRNDLTILLYGPTGAGKSTLAGQLIKSYFMQTRKRAAVFLADEGSRSPYELLEEYRNTTDLKDMGVVTTYRPTGNPWIWVSRALQGRVPKPGKKGIEWVSCMDDTPNIGLIIHEGLTSYAELLMQEMARMSADNVNVGGDGIATLGKDKEQDKGNVLKAWKIDVTGDGEVMRVGGNSMVHYGIAQIQTRDGLLKGRPDVPHLYTAMLRRGNEEGTKAAVSGPQLVGGALTGSLPRWMDLTFRVDAEESGHVLYIMPRPDAQLGGRIMMLANPRLPLEGSKVVVPPMIKPASLVKALEHLALRRVAAREELKGELG